MNPVLVEITRGNRVESIHRGAVAVCDAEGRMHARLGDIERPIYPRSALKPVQALPLLESGAADAFGVSDEEIALACASHSGEPMHTERVSAWLARIGCTADDLACGVHPIRFEPVAEALVREGKKPTRIHNNCSGKHTGFLTLAKHLGIPTKGYETVDHPVQRAVIEALKDLAAMTGELEWGVDGCAAPNFVLPLANLARAMARMANPKGLSPERAAAANRIIKAMCNYPELTAGTGRVCTALIQESGGTIAVKTGAEGVYAAILPKPGLGVALKMDDGSTRAAETAVAQVLVDLEALPNAGEAAKIARAPVRNTRGDIVGERRAAEALLGPR
ncbi:MAG: asparaginase [Alphaproteobacteria bacterium]